MKVIFISGFLAVGLFSLIISMDLIMGTKISQLVQKELNPFQVMEAAEYTLIFLVAFLLFISWIVIILKKKRKAKTS